MTTLFDTDHATGQDGVGLVFEHLNLTGAGNNAVLHSLNKATDVYINDVVFNHYLVAVRGAKDNSGFSNVIHISNSSFQAPGVSGATMIQNPGFNWEVDSNAMEMLTDSPQIVGISAAYTNPVVGFDFHGNFVGDDTGTAVITEFTFTAGSTGIHIHGGNLISATRNTVNAFTFGNNCKGVVIEGNTFASGSTFGTFLTLGTGNVVKVGSNAYGVISTFLSGTPAVGSVVTDNNGITTIYNAATITTANLTNIVGPSGGSLNITDGGSVSRVFFTQGNTNLFLNPSLAGAVIFNNTTAAINSGGKLSIYGNISTVSNGVPTEYATVDSTINTANIGLTTAYAVPASGAGMYRVSGYVIVNRTATTSSTLPNLQIQWTDADNSTVQSLSFASGTPTANSLTTFFTIPPQTIFAKASTNIQYQTGNSSSYTSVRAPSMQYSVHLKIEAL